VVIASIQAYPVGFDFTPSLRLRTVSTREASSSPPAWPSSKQTRCPKVLALRCPFADGCEATDLNRPPHNSEGPRIRSTVLNQHGGGGGGSA
jgi:hypothetical protein